jgi:hypothetical protein
MFFLVSVVVAPSGLDQDLEGLAVGHVLVAGRDA